MLKSRKRELLLILGLVLAVLLMNMPVIYTFFYHDITGKPAAVDGSMDASASRQSDGKLYLDGQWAFYWHRFIVSEPEHPADNELPAEPDMFLQVPGSWSDCMIDGQKLPASGYASYQLTVTGLARDQAISLYLPDFGSAYRVYIDGTPASVSGTVSKETDRVFTVPEADIYPVILSAGATHVIVVEVATTRFSGLYMTPVLGDYHHTIRDNNLRNVLRYILFGVAVFSFLNLISMYAMSVRRKLHSFWMPVMFLFILLRIMLTTEFYSIWQPLLFFNMSYESTNELMYLTTFALKYLLIYLVQEQCGILFQRKERLGFLAYYIILYLVYLFAPKIVNNIDLTIIIPMLTYILDVYLFIKIYRGRETINRLGMVVFWGASLVITGLTLDSYYINGKIYMNMSLALLLFFTLFSFIMSWVYSARMGDLYDDFTLSSSSLELANSQIIMQKEYYESLSAQMNQIREIKHDVHHFVEVMHRLADAGSLDQLRSFLDEYSDKTKMDQLPVFCENVVANSIIGYCYLKAGRYGIPFTSRCSIDKKFAMSDSDLCILLGNALENAIDACSRMDKPDKKFVSVDAETIQGQWLLKVRNSHEGVLVFEDGHYVSSKGGKSHGLGIRNIQRVAAQYGGMVKIEHTDEEFTLMAAIPEKAAAQ